MEQIDQTLIERYLAQEMTPSERSEVELRAEKDPQFRKDLLEYKLSLEAIKLTQREELKSRFKQRDQILDKKNQNRDGGKRISFWWLAIAAAISILVAWFFLYTPQQKTIDEANTKEKDSTNYVEIPPVIIDTIKTNEPKNDEKKVPEKPRKQKKTDQQFFADNFEPYKDETMNPASRSDEEDMKPFDKFQLNYWEGQYTSVPSIFETLTPTQKQNDNLRFMYANALMANQKTEEATLILKGIIQNHKSTFTSEAYFYLALCNIKAGKKDEALKNLQTYLDDQNAKQKEKAKRIVSDLQ